MHLSIRMAEQNPPRLLALVVGALRDHGMGEIAEELLERLNASRGVRDRRNLRKLPR